MRYNRSVGIVYQTIELFVAVVMLMIAGWRAVISIDSKIDGLKKELKTDIDRVDAKVDCQWPCNIARWRTPKLHAHGHLNCTG